MRILVVTSCTGEKQSAPDGQLTKDDFQLIRNPDQFKLREEALAKFRTPAEKLYNGQQHVRLMRGIKQLRKKLGQDALQLWILSAGYGLISGDREIIPYECTFQGMKKRDIREWARFLQVPQDIRSVLGETYDLGIVLLGDAYLAACELDEAVHLGGPTLFFCGSVAARKFPSIPNSKTVVLTNKEAKRFSCGLVGLKGELAARLLSKVAETPAIVPRLSSSHMDLLNLLDVSGRSPVVLKRSAQPHPEVDRVIEIPDSWWERPHRKKLMYFIPEWDDLVDPDFDFETDTHSGGSGDWFNQVYAHQMYVEPNYDGLLVSKVVAEHGKKKRERIKGLGVHRYLRVPLDFPVMGDCGAFGYIMQDEPPYTTDEILDYYTRLGFNYGVSVDHLIVNATDHQRQFRYELTIHNAEEFLLEHKKRGLQWLPIGAVQGWDSGSYAKAAMQYAQMGYGYIGLGGLVRSSTTHVLEIVRQVREVVPVDMKIHLFGLARPAAIADFLKLRVTSVDSASFLRQAWMRTKQSYALPAGFYAALRIPEAGKSFRAKRMKEHAGLDEERILLLEQEALRAVRSLARHKCSVDTCLNALLEYDRFVTTNRLDMTEPYRQTLTDRPWEICDCSLCKASGVEIIIFRGNNRNRRRGFHNTYVFYQLFQRVINGELNVFYDATKDRDHQHKLPLFGSLEEGVR